MDMTATDIAIFAAVTGFATELFHRLQDQVDYRNMADREHDAELGASTVVDRLSDVIEWSIDNGVTNDPFRIY